MPASAPFSMMPLAVLMLANAVPQRRSERLLVEVQMAAEELDKLKTWDVYNDDRY